jgi:hypothetical protein
MGTIRPMMIGTLRSSIVKEAMSGLGRDSSASMALLFPKKMT